MLWAALTLGLVLAFATMVGPVLLFHLLGIGVTKRGVAPGSVCLTFDDGPDPRFTPVILDILRARGARATFFCLGQKVLEHPELVKRICEEGHEVGTHGFDHRHPWADPPGRAMRGVAASVSAIAAIAGRSPRVYRPPWGFWSLWNWLATRQLCPVLWSLPGRDWVRNASPRSVVEHVARHLKPGDIILLHDGGKYSGITAEALPGLLDLIERQGFRTATVSEVISSSNPGASGNMPRATRRGPVRWLKRIARRVWNPVEARFETGRRLIRCGSMGLIRLEPQFYRGPEVTLLDGTVIKVGTPVAEMHLDSRRVAEVYAGGQQSVKGVLTLIGDLMESLDFIRTWLLEDPVGKNVQFIFAVTLLEKELKRLGFEMVPLPVWPWVVVGAYMRWLSYLYRPAGSRPTPGSHLRPKQAWMSRDRFLSRYSAGNSRKLRLQRDDSESAARGTHGA